MVRRTAAVLAVRVWHVHVYPDNEATTAHTVYFLRRPNTLGTISTPDSDDFDDTPES
jgi:hypothetical protein